MRWANSNFLISFPPSVHIWAAYLTFQLEEQSASNLQPLVFVNLQWCISLPPPISHFVSVIYFLLPIHINYKSPTFTCHLLPFLQHPVFLSHRHQFTSCLFPYCCHIVSLQHITWIRAKQEKPTEIQSEDEQLVQTIARSLDLQLFIHSCFQLLKSEDLSQISILTVLLSHVSES